MNAMPAHDADVIVVGSGPSGVAAASPLAGAGMRVLLLDGGLRRDERLVPRGTYHDIRRNDPEQWRLFLGPNLEGLRDEGPPSPKFSAPAGRFSFVGFERAERIVARGLTVVGSLARGGLSNIWGAGIAVFEDKDLAGFPLSAGDLRPAYERVAQRMGVTGFGADDLGSALDDEMPSLAPVEPAQNARRLLERYRRRRAAVNALGVCLGRPRVALLTEERPGRQACNRCDMCLWGCARESIWSAAHDLPELTAYANLDYRPGHLVQGIAPVEGGYRLAVRRDEAGADPARLEFRARRVVLAAGTLVTTRLAMDLLGHYDTPVRLLNAPGAGFALCLPERIGSALATHEFSMAHVSFRTVGDAADGSRDSYGNLFPASGLPAAMIVERMPLSRPGAVRLFRYLQPALLLGNCFLPGHYSDNTARLERDGAGQPHLVVQGGTSADLPGRLDDVRRRLGAALRKLGAFLLPGSFTPIRPGEDLRYSGTLPMRENPGPAESAISGELHGAPGLYSVDLSVFPVMPAKHHTLTMMANADRVGHGIVEAWRRETH